MTSRTLKAAQKGFGIVSAIFVLVILAGLAVAMTNLSATQHTSLALDVEGARAYQAARGGVEWALYQSLIVSPGTACAPKTSFKPSASTLSSFTVTVECADDATNPATNPQIVMRQLTVTACNQPATDNHCPGTSKTSDYLERKVQATIQRPNP